MENLQVYYEQYCGDTHKFRPFSSLSIQEKETLKNTIEFRIFDFQQKTQVLASEATKLFDLFFVQQAD